jgi:carbon monoxide dehydrogenase subunit G
MKVTGTSTLAADPATVYRALNDPAVLVRTIPGCQRLEALGGDAYAMTVAAGVGSIKGVYDGQVRLTDHAEPDSFTLHAEGAGAAGTIGAQVAVLLAEAPGGGTSLSYDADAVVGGMIGGVGQRMLTGVSKRMADEFFRNVEAALAGLGTEEGVGVRTGGAGATVDGPGGRREAPDGSGAPAPAGRSAAPGTVYTAPPAATGRQPTFLQGVVVGAAAALVGALVGGWIAGRRG